MKTFLRTLIKVFIWIFNSLIVALIRIFSPIRFNYDRTASLSSLKVKAFAFIAFSLIALFIEIRLMIRISKKECRAIDRAFGIRINDPDSNDDPSVLAPSTTAVNPEDNHSSDDDMNDSSN